MSPEHQITAIGVRKMDAGRDPIFWDWKCSCGRESKGWQQTEQKAISAGHDHIPCTCGRFDATHLFQHTESCDKYRPREHQHYG